MQNEKKSNNTMETRRFILACVMVFAGIIMLFWGFYVEPLGSISSSVLGASGEVFVFAGSLLSLDSYVNWKITKYINNKDK